MMLWWAPAEAEALSWRVGSQGSAWSLPHCPREARNREFVLFYYVRAVYPVAWDSGNFSRGTAEKQGD